NGFTLSGGAVSVNTDVHPNSITASGSYTLTGPGKIAGAGGITMAGAAGAVFAVNTANTYDGLTTVNSGTLQANNASALGSTVGGTVVASGASLAVSNGIALAGEPITLNGNGTASNNGALRTLDPVNAVTVSAPITLGSNARIAAGPSGSQLIITAPVTDNGSNFTLFVQVPSANSTVLLNSSGNVAGNLQVFGSTVRFGVNNTFPSSSLSTGSGLFDLNGTTQTFAGLQQGSTPNNGVITNSSASAATLDINYSGTNSAAFASAISGAVNVVKDGTGAQSFGGGTSVTNTYSGTTTVNAGILGLATDMSRVTNSFIVNNGGTLRGITTIGGSVTVNSGGTIYAGYASNSIGTLTINNGLSLAGNTIIAVNKDVSPSNDVINVSGPLQYGGTLTVYNLGTNALVAGDTFTVFPPGGTGTVSIQSEPGVTFSFNDGVLTVVSVTAPEPPSLGYTALGSGVFQFNWTGAYKLQWQTNALSIGLGSNWVDYPDTSNPVNVTNNPAIPASFFRLISL
ncbi:MAG: beta strand repeat-containing protein, partial [Verrucomicrobiota bacterium]